MLPVEPQPLSYSHVVKGADQKHGMVVGAGRAMSRLASHPLSGAEESLVGAGRAKSRLASHPPSGAGERLVGTGRAMSGAEAGTTWHLFSSRGRLVGAGRAESRLASHPPIGVKAGTEHLSDSRERLVGAGRAKSRLVSHSPVGAKAATTPLSSDKVVAGASRRSSKPISSSFLNPEAPQFVPRESTRPETEVKMSSILLPSATFQVFEEIMPAKRRKNGKDHALCSLMFMKQAKQSIHASKARRRRRVSKPAPSVSKASPPSPGSGNLSNLSPFT